MVYVALPDGAFQSWFSDEDTMPRILTLFLMLHWATAFSVLAAMSMLDGSGADALAAFGIQLALDDLQGAHRLALQAAVGFGFAICAVLFWWSFATMLLSLRQDTAQSDDVLRTAFSAAAFLMTIVLIAGAAGNAAHLLQVVATHVAALIASYVAVRSEWRDLPLKAKASDEQLRLAARVKVLHASQVATLGRTASNLLVFKRLGR